VSSLATTFLGRLGAHATPLVPHEMIDGTLLSIALRSEAAWPDLAIDRDAFAARLADAVRSEEDPIAALATLNTSDLYLAFGCAAGNARALAYFERAHLAEVPAFVAHFGFDAASLQDLMQALRRRLLVGADGDAKIAGYSGRGPLGGWLRVSAIRLALTTKKGEGQKVRRGDEAMIRPAEEADPELRLFKETYRREFKEAFDRAIAMLETEERAVLRLHYKDGLSIDQIGVAYAIHRATAARWLAQGREKIASTTRSELKKSLKISERDLESVLRLIESQMDVTLERALDDDSSPGE
jgi:RNA polymerase sigma-70 factor (ECF subfamily)